MSPGKIKVFNMLLFGFWIKTKCECVNFENLIFVSVCLRVWAAQNAHTLNIFTCNRIQTSFFFEKNELSNTNPMNSATASVSLAVNATAVSIIAGILESSFAFGTANNHTTEQMTHWASFPAHPQLHKQTIHLRKCGILRVAFTFKNNHREQ